MWKGDVEGCMRCGMDGECKGEWEGCGEVWKGIDVCVVDGRARGAV